MASSPELGFVPGTEPAWNALGPGCCGLSGLLCLGQRDPGLTCLARPSWRSSCAQVVLSPQPLTGKAYQGAWVGLDYTSHRAYVWKFGNVFKIIISFLHQEKMVS